MNETDLLKNGAEQLGFPLAEETLEKMLAYLKLLGEYHYLGLTGYKTPQEIAQFLLLESLPILNLIPAQAASLLDVGSGGGAPGLVLKIMRPELQVSLLEVTRKKARFLEKTAQELGLTGLEVICQRAETAGRLPQYRESFPLATSRGLAGLPALLELVLPFVSVGGTFLAFKGEKYQEEIAQAQKALRILKGEIREVHSYRLPFSGVEGKILEIVKTAPTTSGFPRLPGIPKKNPL